MHSTCTTHISLDHPVWIVISLFVVFFSRKMWFCQFNYFCVQMILLRNRVIFLLINSSKMCSVKTIDIIVLWSETFESHIWKIRLICVIKSGQRIQRQFLFACKNMFVSLPHSVAMSILFCVLFWIFMKKCTDFSIIFY